MVPAEKSVSFYHVEIFIWFIYWVMKIALVVLEWKLMYYMFSGVATSFFNEKNRNLIRDLVELIIETKQELPSWLEGMAMDIKHQSGGLSRRGGGGRGGG